MAATYSINLNTPTKSTFKGNLDPNLFLSELPNNTAQLIVPEDLRDAIFTIWDNISFKRVSVTGSSIDYIGIGGQNHTDAYLSNTDGLKILLGKPKLINTDILGDNLLDYNSNDTDIFIYNLKPNNFGGGSNDAQFTKMSFLAGGDKTLFSKAPYLMAQQNVGGTPSVDLTIYNEGGKLIIDSNQELVLGSPNTKVTLLYGTGSTGISTRPSGLPGDIQLNLDNCDFGSVNGASGSQGDFLMLGLNNKPYWGSISISSLFTLNQVLSAGNITNGKDIVVSSGDSIYINSVTGSNGGLRLYNSISGTYSYIQTPNELRIGANKLRIDVLGLAPNRVLSTDSNGFAYWRNRGDTISLREYTVATLPSSPTMGNIAFVTDALSPSYLVKVVGGGSIKCPVFYNGVDWVCH